MTSIGIDIGGTNLNFGLVRNGQVASLVSTPSFASDATLEQTLEYLAAHIRKIFHPDTKRIGIGVPSVVDVKKGIVYDTQNIPSWKEVPLKDYLEDKFQVPVAVNNDANCFAMGVWSTFPADAKPETLVVLTLGTGVGTGIVNEGKLFCGANCGAGEICGLPYRDSILEDYCSKKFFTNSGWDSKQVDAAACQGDPKALAFFDEFGRHLGALICASMFAYDPSHIVLAGGIANNYPHFHRAMEAYVREHFPYRKAIERLNLDICTNDNIPVIGASLI
ncbi:MAG: ROK family protein [Bacteroidales bacterium]|nr:ROK family protein [Bacteroidales bacterium]